jgi:catechol 2,3-dioxygenase-like lactoylglutathione lyase family enzyme
MRRPSITSTVPILASMQLDESVAFYTGKLGFVLLAQLEDYVIVGREGCEIHFYACDNQLIAQNTACYIRTGSTDALFEEFTARGLALQAPELQPWGMKELYVIDPHGNLLKFGELG